MSRAPRHPVSPARLPALSLEAAIALLDRLVAFPTVSSLSNRDCIDWIAARLEPLGARISLSSDAPGKANLFATLGPDGDGGVILSGHTDVVPVEGQDWSSDPFRLRRAEGRLYGRGTCDMKGFVACALHLAETLDPARLRRPLHLAFTYDEETGCLGARVLVQALRESGLRPAIAVIGEPTGMKIIDGHKGCCEYTTVFHGVEGHSSLPQNGVNALEFASRYIARLMELRAQFPDRAPRDSRFDPPHTTLSVTGLKAGVAHNVIPNRAELMWEMRPVQDSDRAWLRERMEHFVTTELAPAMRGSTGWTGTRPPVEEHFVSEVAALEPEAENAAVELLCAVTGSNETGVVSFGTEAGLFQGAGLAAALCGPGDIEQAHKPDEFVTEAQLAACLEMMARLARRLSD